MSSIAKQDNFTQLDWYLPLVESIHDNIKMAVIESRTRLVEGHWSVGKLIRTASEGIDVTELVHTVALDLRKYMTEHDPTSPGISERTLWYCLKAYDTYPDFTKLPDGNNISWRKLITNYLTASTDKPDEENLLTCPNCGFKSNREDFK